MTRRKLFIWQKRARPPWFEANEARLRQLAGPKLAIIVEGKTTVLEVCGEHAVVERLRVFAGNVEQLPDDWFERVQRLAQTPPVRIGRRLVISNERSSASTRVATLIIPAGAAFGTGAHATTAMSLRLLEQFSRKLSSGWRMLDLGTGSGILALAAKRFGGGEVVAIDSDPLAIRTAKANACANGIRGVEFRNTDVRTSLPRGAFEIICANLYSELLIKILPHLVPALAPGGVVILSGVLRTQEREVRLTLEAAGLRQLVSRRRGKWVAIAARKDHC